MHYTYAYLDTLSKKGEYIYKRDGEETISFEYEVFYIGKGLKSRPSNHLTPSSLSKNNTHKNNKIKKIKKITGENTIIVIISTFLTDEESIELEKKYIKIIGRRDIKTGPLTNKTDGGEGMSGNISTKRGIATPLETCLKLSVSGKGRIISEKTKQKMTKNRCMRTYKLISPEGIETITDNLTKFCKNNNLNQSCMNLVANGKRNNHKEWKVEIIQNNMIIKPIYKGYYEYTDPVGNIYSSNNNVKFCKDFYLTVPGIRSVVYGKTFKHKGWICRKIDIEKNLLTHYYQPDKYKSSIIYNYFITDPDGHKWETNNLTQFCKIHKIGRYPLICVFDGKRLDYKGWTGYKEKIKPN